MGEDFDGAADGLIRSFRRLAQAKGPDAQLLVLIDPILGDPMPELNFGHAIPISRLRVRHDDMAKEDAPYLLRVGKEEAHERLVAQTIRIALAEQQASLDDAPSARSVCAWLFIQEGDLFKLTEALSRLSVVAGFGDPSKASIFRFWDPRVFQHLARILGRQDFEGFLGSNVAAQWVWLGSDGQLKEHTFKGGAAWRPSSAQWQALSRIEDLNQCLLFSEAYASPDPSARIHELDGALQRANELQCRESVDRITYALLAQSLGGSFEHHPLMLELFKQLASEGVSFAALAEAVDQSLWDQVKSDMAQSRRHT